MKSLIKLISVITAAVIAAVLIPSSATLGAGASLEDAVLLYIGSPVALARGNEVMIDENPEVAPYIKNDRTMVPIRFVAETLGETVIWSPEDRQIEIGGRIQLWIGKSEMVLDGEKITLDSAPEISNDRTFVPIYFIGRAFGRTPVYERGLVVISENGGKFLEGQTRGEIDALIARINTPPAVGSAENLAKLLKNADITESFYDTRVSFGLASGAAEKAAAPVPAPQSNKMKDSAAGGDYSTTNIQVEGVDEADIVKTDGKYIYKINYDKLVIAKAAPPEELSVVNTLSFNNATFAPSEMYVDENYLVIIGAQYEVIRPYPYAEQPQAAPKLIMPRYQNNMVRAVVYDISDKENLKKLREVEIEGNLVSSRRIGNHIYLVSNMYLYRYDLDGKVPPEDITPLYKDSAKGGEYQNTGLEKLRYFPGFVGSNCLVVAGFDIADSDSEVFIDTYLGAGNEIYVSRENMYITTQSYNYRIMADVGFNASETKVYKFSLANGKATFIAKGSVPGTVLNQFSMDEYEGNFRVATTGYNERGQSLNNLFILGEMLEKKGEILDIAPGERIYSVRFMGERGYMVTFEKVDPLFVLDLADPAAPKILGKLKIPGYSDYLHPYDENHLIGFGKDAVEVPVKDGSGKVIDTNAFYLGMKIAIFDVSDVENPIELHKEIIGDRGTHSEILDNHKALLFSREKSLLAFPISISEVKGEKFMANGMPNYGQQTFAGALIYNIDLENGFTRRAEISHFTEEEKLKAGGYYTGNSMVERIIYIGDTLYTLSQNKIEAHSLSTMETIKSVSLNK